MLMVNKLNSIKRSVNGSGCGRLTECARVSCSIVSFTFCFCKQMLIY